MTKAILKATGLAAVLAVGCIVAGYAAAVPLISVTGSLLGFDELVVTGPNDEIVARLS